MKTWINLWRKQLEEAIIEGERVLALDYNHASGYDALAEVLNYAGRPEEAREFAEKAMRLDPRNREVYLYNMGVSYALTRQYEKAVAALKSVLTRYLTHLGAQATIVAVYSESGREEEARAATAEVLKFNPDFSLEFWSQTLPFTDPTTLEQVLAALRKAGLK